MVDTLLLILYALIGVVMAIAGIEAFRAKDNPARIGTGLFWIIMAIVFAFGTLLPAIGRWYFGRYYRYFGLIQADSNRQDQAG